MKKIFVVEDDHDIREMVEFILTNQEYKVQSFSTAEEFNKGMTAQKPDLILLDIMLPDGNGVEICRGLKQQIDTNGIPVVLMSAHANAKNLKEECANDFIAKPFDVDDLLARLHKQLN